MLNTNKLRSMRKSGLFNKSTSYEEICSCNNCERKRMDNMLFNHRFGWIIKIIAITTVLFIFYSCHVAHAMPEIAPSVQTIQTATAVLITNTSSTVWIDLDIIAQIESSMDYMAYNDRTQATGLYQITPICLKDYNMYHKLKYTLQDMFNPKRAYIVALWYFNDRIPGLLRHYKIKDNLKNRLVCWNAGIAYLTQHKALPVETKNYIKHYARLKGE